MPQGSVQFEVENVDGITVVSGFGEENIEVRPGERVLITQENSLTAGDPQPGLRDSSCLKAAS